MQVLKIFNLPDVELAPKLLAKLLYKRADYALMAETLLYGE